MATHSSVLAWRIPGTGEPDGLPSMGSHRVRHDWSDLAAAAAAWCHEKKFFFIKKMCFCMLAPPFPNHMTLGKSLWFLHLFSSVQSLSCVWLFVTPWTAAHQAFLSITNFQSLLKLMSIVLVMPSNHLILCRPLLPCLQSFPASGSFPVSQFFASGGQSIYIYKMELKIVPRQFIPLSFSKV